MVEWDVAKAHLVQERGRRVPVVAAAVAEEAVGLEAVVVEVAEVMRCVRKKKVRDCAHHIVDARGIQRLSDDV